MKNKIFILMASFSMLFTSQLVADEGECPCSKFLYGTIKVEDVSFDNQRMLVKGERVNDAKVINTDEDMFKLLLNYYLNFSPEERTNFNTVNLPETIEVIRTNGDITPTNLALVQSGVRNDEFLVAIGSQEWGRDNMIMVRDKNLANSFYEAFSQTTNLGVVSQEPSFASQKAAITSSLESAREKIDACLTAKRQAVLELKRHIALANNDLSLDKYSGEAEQNLKEALENAEETVSDPDAKMSDIKGAKASLLVARDAREKQVEEVESEVEEVESTKPTEEKEEQDTSTRETRKADAPKEPEKVDQTTSEKDDKKKTEDKTSEKKSETTVEVDKDDKKILEVEETVSLLELLGFDTYRNWPEIIMSLYQQAPKTTTVSDRTYETLELIGKTFKVFEANPNSENSRDEFLLAATGLDSAPSEPMKIKKEEVIEIADMAIRDLVRHDDNFNRKKIDLLVFFLNDNKVSLPKDGLKNYIISTIARATKTSFSESDFDEKLKKHVDDLDEIYGKGNDKTDTIVRGVMLYKIFSS